VKQCLKEVVTSLKEGVFVILNCRDQRANVVIYEFDWLGYCGFGAARLYGLCRIEEWIMPVGRGTTSEEFRKLGRAMRVTERDLCEVSHMFPHAFEWGKGG